MPESKDGFSLAAIAIGVFVYGFLRIVPAVEAPFREVEARISEIKVQTKTETTLKQMLLKTTRHSAKGWKAYAETKTTEAGFTFWCIAMILIAVYGKDRTYQSIIRKIKSSELSTTKQ